MCWDSNWGGFDLKISVTTQTTPLPNLMSLYVDALIFFEFKVFWRFIVGSISRANRFSLFFISQRNKVTNCGGFSKLFIVAAAVCDEIWSC